MSLRRPQWNEPGTLVRLLAWTVFALRVGVFDQLELLRSRSINDYGSFHAAAYAISEGLDPYAPASLQASANAAGLPGVHPYFYPPFLAELLVPFTWLQPLPARVVWGLLSLVAFAFSMKLLDRWLAEQPIETPSEARAAFAVIIASFWPIRETQWGAQVNGFVLVLLVLWMVSRERTPRAAIALGVAAAIKMSPAILIAVPLMQRRFREAAIAAGTAAGLVLVSCALLGRAGFRFLSDVLLGFLPGHHWHGLSVPIDVHGNHSLAAFAYWLVDAGQSSDHLKLSSSAATVHGLLALGLLAAWVARSRKVSSEAAIASLTVLMVIVPTYAFEHHLAFLTLAFAPIAVLLLSGKMPKTWAFVTVAAIALLLEPTTMFAIPESVSTRLAGLSHLPKLAPMLVLFAIGLLGAGLDASATRDRVSPA